MFRAVAVLRVVVLLNCLALNYYRRDVFDRPGAAALVLALITAWTVFALWWPVVPRRRTAWFLVADLAVAVGAMLTTPLLKGPDWNATVPGFWVTGALTAWAVHWRWQGGLAAAAVLSATDLLLRDEIDQGDYGNVFLLMIAGPIIGFLSESIQRMAAERDVAQREAAVAAERARLARAVHDGVLQVLALVQRQGPTLGPQGAELGRLAGEQETALRSLIRRQDTLVSPSGEGTLDLTSELEQYVATRSLRLDVVTPGTPVEVPAGVGRDLLAVVGACLDNVATHVRPDAPAWLLLERLEGAVVVTVRDEGPGIPDGRIAQAEAEGRLGVAESIRGRMRDLGGSATLFTAPGRGVEWELTLPL